MAVSMQSGGWQSPEKPNGIELHLADRPSYYAGHIIQPK